MVTYLIKALILDVIFIVISVAVTNGEVSCGHVNLTASTTAKEITSPGFPDGYESNIMCRWDIYTHHGDMIKMEVLWSDLDRRSNRGRYRFYCGQRDQVKVYDGVPPGDLLGISCGSQTPTYLSKSRSATIMFQTSNDGRGGKGFKLRYSEGNFSHHIISTTRLDAEALVKSFSTPSYEYSNHRFVQMSWRIESVKEEGELYIRTIKSNLKALGCGKDFNRLLAFDGYDNKSKLLGDWCENELVEKTASGKYIYVILNTKPFNDVKFSIQYGIHMHESKGSSSSGVGGIAGVSIGVIAFIGVAYLVGKILCEKYSDKSDDDSNGSGRDNAASRQSLFEQEQGQNATVPASTGTIPSAPPPGNDFALTAPPPSYDEVIRMAK